MTGDDLETLLARYQPAGPSEDLRARIMRTAGMDDRIGLPVWLAIAALAACAVLFVGAASSVYSVVIRPDTDAFTQQRSAAVESMANSLGGGQLGREQALETASLADRELAAANISTGAVSPQ